MKLAGAVLAAGLGTRMNSSASGGLPKVLHKLHGTTMFQHVLNTLHKLKPQKIVIIVGRHFREIKESAVVFPVSAFMLPSIFVSVAEKKDNSTRTFELLTNFSIFQFTN